MTEKKTDQIRKEVEALVQSTLDAGRPVRRAWLLKEVVSSHDAISGADSDWYTICAYGHVGKVVRDVLRDLRNDDGDQRNPQMTLDGFDRVQLGYSTTRDGEQVLIPTEQLTYSELTEKAQHYFTLSAGCRAHGEELIRYRNERYPEIAEQ